MDARGQPRKIYVQKLSLTVPRTNTNAKKRTSTGIRRDYVIDSEEIIYTSVMVLVELM